jgi:hypothetical protein
MMRNLNHSLLPCDACVRDAAGRPAAALRGQGSGPAATIIIEG